MRTNCSPRVRKVGGRGCRTRLVIIGPLPPPYHGVTVSTELVRANRFLAAQFDVRDVDTSDARGLETIGRWDPQNAFGAILSIGRFLSELRERHGVVYLPLSQSMGGFVRDSVFINLAAWRKWKVAVHLHGSELDQLYVEQARPVRWYIRTTLRRIDSIAVLGNSLRRVVAGLLPEDRIAVIPNGTPAPDNGQSAHDRQLGVFLGNFLRRKGVIEAVRAAALVVAREPGARFLFVGDWEDEHLEREARALASVAGPQIQFQEVTVGRRKSALLARAGFLLFPPVRPEGHPRVILEALAAALPVITTDQGAIAETVVHGESGFVLADASPELLAEAMLMLIRDAALWTRMSAAARQRYHALYRQEIADRRIAEWLAGVVSPSRERGGNPTGAACGVGVDERALPQL